MKHEAKRRRRSASAIITIAIELIGFSLAHAEDLPDVPSVVFARSLDGQSPVPAWVSAEVAMTPSHVLAEHLFYPDQADTLRTVYGLTAERASAGQSGVRLLEEDNCPAFVSVLTSRRDKPIDRGLLNLLGDAKIVLIGSIVESTPGFYYGSGASLLTVELTEVIRRSDQKAISLPEHIHFGYGSARFSINDIPVCTRSADSKRSAVVGSRLLLFSELRFLDESGSLLDFRYQELVFEKEGGGLVLPPNLVVDDEMVGVDTLEDLITKVRAGHDLIGLTADAAEGTTR